jgi:hypothetical protein
VAGVTKAMKNSNFSIGNRTRHVPACAAESQPIAPQHTPRVYMRITNIMVLEGKHWLIKNSAVQITMFRTDIYKYHHLSCWEESKSEFITLKEIDDIQVDAIYDFSRVANCDTIIW